MYENTGSGFELNETITFLDNLYNIDMTDDASTIYVTTKSFLAILKKTSNGTYSSTTAVTYSSRPWDSAISKDETLFIISCWDGLLHIF